MGRWGARVPVGSATYKKRRLATIGVLNPIVVDYVALQYAGSLLISEKELPYAMSDTTPSPPFGNDSRLILKVKLEAHVDIPLYLGLWPG